MAYQSLKEIIRLCGEEGIPFWRAVLQDDMNERSVSEAESRATMGKMWEAMLAASENYDPSLTSGSGLVGKDGAKMEEYRKQGGALVGDFVGKVIAQALQMGESNACMKRIVAAPTAGACGVLPAVLVPLYQENAGEYKEAESRESARNCKTAEGCEDVENRESAGGRERVENGSVAISRERIVEALYVAAGIGQVIAARAFIAGAQGGCQAEVGSASSMAAGALVYLKGGDNEQIVHAVAMAMKNLLGLVCDPVAGLVEVPCVKRNVIGAVNALAAADMALAGITSRIPPDQVIDAMKEVGESMHVSLRETGEGGVANTPYAREVAKEIHGKG